MKINKLVQTFALVIFFLFLIWLSYQIILKLTGHSPSINTILTTAIAMIISFLFVATLKLGEFIGETKAFMNNTQESFKRIKEDMQRLK